MQEDERVKIIKELRCVDMVVKSIDRDRTVCKTLETIEPKPDSFCKGGDQNNNTIPETDICEKRGIELRDGFGENLGGLSNIRIASGSPLTDNVPSASLIVSKLS